MAGGWTSPPSSVRPGFVTGPATAPLGEGSFRFDTGAPGAAAAGAKVELSNGALNDQLVADLTGLRFDVYLEENDVSASEQPYINLKVDADANGSIDTTLTYIHTPIPLNDWTVVDTQDGSATGAFGWSCISTVVTMPGAGSRITWTQVLALLPDGAVFQNSTRLPPLADLQRGPDGSPAGETVRGAVDRLTWSLGDDGHRERLRAGGDQRGRQHRPRAGRGFSGRPDRREPQRSQRLPVARCPAGRPPRPAGHGELRHCRWHGHRR